MASVGDVLLVAFKLGVLTFYIGVLVYALPIPWRPLKKWAPMLIWDGIASAMLSMLFYFAVEASNEIASMLGGSWTFFNYWASTASTVLLSVKSILVAVSAVLSSLKMGTVSKLIVSPIDKVVDVGLVTVFWIMGLGYFVQKFGLLLAAIGVALYAAPFRATRGAGAWLLAFYLVFNAGLQVMPSFMAAVAEQPGRPDPGKLEEHGLALARLRVEDWRNEPVSGILEIHVSGEAAARLRVNSGYASDPITGSLVAVPSRSPVHVYLVVDGVMTALSPYPLTPSDYEVSDDGIWSATLRASSLLWLGDYLILATTGSLAGVEEVNETAWIIEVSLEAGDAVIVRYPSACDVYLEAEGLDESMSNWVWAGIAGEEVRLEAGEQGVYEVFLVKEGECPPVSPDVQAKSYISWAADLGSFKDIHVVAAYMLYYTTVPFLYVFVLFAATAGLARALGGRDRLMVRI